jgi:ribonuclease-3
MMSLQDSLGYHFRNATLLKHALTHRSAVRGEQDENNQRLEFLGDSVLGMLIAEMLYRLYPAEAEGDLSKRLVSLVNGAHLAGIAKTMRLGEHLILSEGEEEQGGRENPSNLEDACEALLGAVYLDGGLDAARGLVDRFWRTHAETMKAPPKDAKTALQEWAQGRGLPLPEYRLVSAEGPSHAPHFIIDVFVENQGTSRGEAGTKRLAERLAAAAMLAQVGV